MAKKNKCPLVIVRWEDSAQPIAKWQHLSSFEPTGIILCASVGWKIHDADGVVALAPNMGAIDDATNIQASGVIHIPKRCIISIEKLVEK
jgi:hypothetical protein